MKPNRLPPVIKLGHSLDPMIKVLKTGLGFYSCGQFGRWSVDRSINELIQYLYVRKVMAISNATGSFVFLPNSLTEVGHIKQMMMS